MIASLDRLDGAIDKLVQVAKDYLEIEKLRKARR